MGSGIRLPESTLGTTTNQDLTGKEFMKSFNPDKYDKLLMWWLIVGVSISFVGGIGVLISTGVKNTLLLLGIGLLTTAIGFIVLLIEFIFVIAMAIVILINAIVKYGRERKKG